MSHQIEDPFALLDIDIYKITPHQLLERFNAITNSMVVELQRRNQNRDALINTNKKDPQYDTINKERYDIDNRIDALEAKVKGIEQMLYIKSAEMRMANKGHLI